MSFEYEKCLPAYALRGYKAKIEVVGLDKCPYKLPFDIWTNNPKLWPDVSYACVEGVVKFNLLLS